MLSVALAVRVGATACFVLAMGWLVARARPGVAAVAIATPVVIGPGFAVLALERDAAFVARAAEDALGALAGTVAFAVVVARLAGRMGRAGVLGAALAAWLAVAWAAGWATGWAGNAGVFALAWALGLWVLRGAPPPVRHRAVWAPRAEGLRALAAGALVAGVTLAAERLGPTVSGTLIALPVGMLFVSAGVLRIGDGTVARQVMGAGARGAAALAMFLGVLRGLIALGMAPLPGVGVATLAAVAAALALGLRPARTGE
ncbi:hypothetical protein [Rhodobaculum claviforme]|uniref:Uncharacterized protein n=1 Tax=Rhodobaculum claviforme TaxID=1549854 RepID=A0A934WJ49_9RHOB|nr:hypothetical protein [Rhodobaculum claviforme]MBK5927557.1 hypothetical protein [Rhodobaculum claviforme]